LQPLIGRVEVQKLEMKLKEMNVTNLDSWHISYSLMFPNPSVNKIDHFTYLLRDIGAWPTDAVEYVLLVIVILFSSNMLDLIDKKRVEEQQEMFLLLLHKYLTRKYRDSYDLVVSRLAAGVQCVVKCRDLHNIFNSIPGNLEIGPTV